MVTSLQSQYLRLLQCDDISHNGFCRLLKGFGSLAGIMAAASNPDEGVSTKLDSAGVSESALHRLVDRVHREQPDRLLDDTDRERRSVFGRLFAKASHETVQMPRQEVGTILIYRVFDNLSYGVIITSSEPARLGDLVFNP